MRYIYLLLATIILPQFLFAQSNYKPATIVNLKGDTVKGYINYHEWAQNPEFIDFKADVTAHDVKRYDVAHITSFSITGYEIYRRYHIKVSADQVNINNLSTGLDTSSRFTDAFLRVIATGPNVTLYSYKDSKQHYYIQPAGSTEPYELSYHVFYSPKQERILIHDNYYQDQLKELATKYKADPKVFKQINHSEYTASFLVKIADMLNGKARGTTKSKVGLRLFTGIGVNYAKLDYSGKTVLAQGVIENKPSIFPTISLGIDVLPNVNVGRFIFRTELMVTKANFKVDVFNPEYSMGIYVREFNQVDISVVPQALLNVYNKRDFKVYLSGGASINFSSYTNNNYSRNYTNPPLVIQETMYKDLQSTWVAPTVRLGTVIGKHYEIYASYAMPTGISPYFGFSAQESFKQLGIHYLIGK